MKEYSVKDIADMLDTNPETVRRWIRSGKLKADQVSRKDGNMVREDELYRYLSSASKYKSAATDLASANPMLALSTTTAAATIAGVKILVSAIGSLVSTKKRIKTAHDALVPPDDVEQALINNLHETVDSIKRKKAMVEELMKEISKEEQLILYYQEMLEQISKARSADIGNESGEVND